MRDIKFRQWLDGHFHYWGVGIRSDGVECSFVGPCSGGSVRADRTPQEQFTGLSDCNGVEVYEGDIVESNDMVPTEVCFDRSTCCFSFGDWWISDYMVMSDTMSLKIVGNIHQNPELLK